MKDNNILEQMKSMNNEVLSEIKKMEAGIRSDMKDMEAGIRFDMNKRFDEVDKRVNQIDCLLKKELPGINEEHKYTVNNIAEVKDDIKIICEFIGIKKAKVNNITSVV